MEFSQKTKNGTAFQPGNSTGSEFLSPLGKYWRVWLLNHMVQIYFVLWETAKLSSKVAVPFCILTSNVPFAPNPYKHLVVVSVPELGHSKSYVMVSQCHLNLHFPDDMWWGTSFCMIICYLYISFGEVSIKVFDLVFNCIISSSLCFNNSLYILGMSPSSGVFLKIFLLNLLGWH